MVIKVQFYNIAPEGAILHLYLPIVFEKNTSVFRVFPFAITMPSTTANIFPFYFYWHTFCPVIAIRMV